MDYDYNLWTDTHIDCVNAVKRLCELDNSKNTVKCSATLCVMSSAMQDINSYFNKKCHSTADLYFLIRNIDVIIGGILDINNLLFGIGLHKQDKAIKKCFIKNAEVISKFRTLRSQTLAHPVDTYYPNVRGESEIIYLEEVRPYSSFDSLLLPSCDFVKTMRKPETNEVYSESLNIKDEIIPVIKAIIDTLPMLVHNINDKIDIEENNLQKRPLSLNRESVEEYIKSLDVELEKRYPSAVEDITFADGSTKHYSIIYECLMYFSEKYKTNTQTKYDIFLKYILSELHKIEADLQNMCFNEDHYFELLYNRDFAQGLSYEKSKMEYLRESDKTSYTESDIDSNVKSNTLWGIRCFRLLMPYIEQYLPVDVSVSDKGLYCEYLASEYLSNITTI